MLWKKNYTKCYKLTLVCFLNLEGKEVCVNHSRICIERLLDRGKEKQKSLSC